LTNLVVIFKAFGAQILNNHNWKKFQAYRRIKKCSKLVSLSLAYVEGTLVKIVSFTTKVNKEKQCLFKTYCKKIRNSNTISFGSQLEDIYNCFHGHQTKFQTHIPAHIINFTIPLFTYYNIDMA
jgi:UDP-N-acetylmuramyl pentapeptide synthase